MHLPISISKFYQDTFTCQKDWKLCSDRSCRQGRANLWYLPKIYRSPRCLYQVLEAPSLPQLQKIWISGNLVNHNIQVVISLTYTAIWSYFKLSKIKEENLPAVDQGLPRFPWTQYRGWRNRRLSSSAWAGQGQAAEHQPLHWPAATPSKPPNDKETYSKTAASTFWLLSGAPCITKRLSVRVLSFFGWKCLPILGHMGIGQHVVTKSFGTLHLRARRPASLSNCLSSFEYSF